MTTEANDLRIHAFARSLSHVLHEAVQPLATLRFSLELAHIQGSSAPPVDDALLAFESLKQQLDLVHEMVRVYKKPVSAERLLLNQVLLRQVDGLRLAFEEQSVGLSAAFEHDLPVWACRQQLDQLSFCLLRGLGSMVNPGEQLQISGSIQENDAKISISCTPHKSIPENSTLSRPMQRAISLSETITNANGGQFDFTWTPLQVSISFPKYDN